MAKPSAPIELPCIGSVRSRSVREISGSNWLLGCETLDRDYADYDQYKDYLPPLGIRRIRLQGGWAKTETVRGQYDWGWMDHIVDDALARGLQPWLQTGYGNPIYPGAGGSNLGAGMPLSQEGRAAYEAWVTAMVTRYADRVFDWEVWNEPNFGDNKVNTPEITAEFNARTARIIKKIQPQARISALALGHIDLDYVERFFAELQKKDACHLFHDVTYHDYVYNPDSNALAVYQMREIVRKYAPHLILRQGENGAPSSPWAGGALCEYDWSEISQAKWYLRRMLENLGHDIECSVFSIAEMQYDSTGPITKANTKGLLQTNPHNQVLRAKPAYYAVRHVTAIFDDHLVRLPGVKKRFQVDQCDQDSVCYGTDHALALYGYEDRETQARLYTLWQSGSIPGDSWRTMKQNLTFASAHFQEPVLVELLTGNVYAIPADNWKKDGNLDRFTEIPVFDTPVLLAEKALIPMAE